MPVPHTAGFPVRDQSILAALRLGIGQAELRNRCVFSSAPQRVRSRFTARAAELMVLLQRLNDKGYRWGQMPERARRFLQHGW